MGMWTQADVDTLKTAVASGVLEVRFDGPPMRLVRYQSLQAMSDQLARMQRDVAGQAGGCSFSLAATSKGL